MPTQDELIQKTHDAVLEIKTVLLGVPNTDDTGLVGEVKAIKIDCNILNNRHRKLSRNFWILVGILAGTGVVGGSIYQLLGG